MWLDAKSKKVGRGSYTKNAANRKFCSWKNDGMHWFNELNLLVQENRVKQYTKQVEEETFKTLTKRYESMLSVNHKNSQEKYHYAAMQKESDNSNDCSIT